MDATLRPIRAEDEAFLREVYAGTRETELSITGWSEAQKDAFLRMQFDAQHLHYTTHHPDASFDVVECGGEPIGRLYVERSGDEIRIIDIALLPTRRGRGFGTELVRRLIEESETRRVPVRIHVERENQAMRWYRRLGFVPVREQGVHWLMERPPDGESKRRESGST